MTKIKDISIIILIVFIIASILYGIHMFRYEFIYYPDKSKVIRYDRITNEQCYSVSTRGLDFNHAYDQIRDPEEKGNAELYPCNAHLY